MTLTDIKKALADKLKSGISSVNVYAKEVKQGFKKPAFFVEVIPVRTVKSLYYVDKTFSVKIRYYSLTGKYLDLGEKADSLMSLFATALVIGDTKLKVDEADCEILYGEEDDYLEFSFDLSLTEWTEVLEIKNSEDEPVFMLPDEQSGYTQDSIELMSELDLEVQEG